MWRMTYWTWHRQIVTNCHGFCLRTTVYPSTFLKCPFTQWRMTREIWDGNVTVTSSAQRSHIPAMFAISSQTSTPTPTTWLRSEPTIKKATVPPQHWWSRLLEVSQLFYTYVDTSMFIWNRCLACLWREMGTFQSGVMQCKSAAMPKPSLKI